MRWLPDRGGALDYADWCAAHPQQPFPVLVAIGADPATMLATVAQVIWAVSTRVDLARDAMLVENTPIDYLDFASPVAGIGSKLGLDATNKWPSETARAWSRPIVPDAAVERRVDALWTALTASSAGDR